MEEHTMPAIAIPLPAPFCICKMPSTMETIASGTQVHHRQQEISARIPPYHGRNPKPHAGRTVIRAIIWLIPLLPIVALLSVISLLAVIVLLPAVPLLVTVILLPVISLLVLWLPAIALLVSRLLFFLRIIVKHVIFAFHEKSPFTGYFGTSPAAPPCHGGSLHTEDCANYP